MMRRGSWSGSFLLLSVMAGLLVLAPASLRAAEPIVVTPVPFTDLSDKAEWCESGTDLDIAAIVSGGCHFAPILSGATTHGASAKAFWLRLTLVNPETRPIERWLKIGHPRLNKVGFFVSMADGGWQRTDSGTDIPPARRPIFSSDPILPVIIAPGKSRTILVRVVSRTTIDLTPTLWRSNAYLEEHNRTELLYTLSIGGLAATALFTLMIYVQWKNQAYLYFTAGELAKIVNIASYTTLLPTYLWSGAYDVRVQTVAVGCIDIFLGLFVRHFIGNFERYRFYHKMLMALAASAVLVVGWACLVDYRVGIRALVFVTLLVELGAVMFLWRACRDGFRPAIFLLVPYTISVIGHLYAFLVFFGGGTYGVRTIWYFWGFLISAPAALCGIMAHKNEMQRHLLAARAESAARLEFLAHMSHELRTPLDTILGTAQLLTRVTTRARLAEGLADISESGRHLLKMIDDILDHARGLAHKLTMTRDPVDWPAFLRSVEHSGRILAAGNGNDFSLRASETQPDGLLIDEHRLRQILDNLLANAARHTKDGWIRVDCAARWAGERLRLDFAVADSGEGIPLAEQKRIFLPFERGSRAASRDGGKGTGMGLAISRQFVEMMGGRLTVESRPGSGACFRFHILAERADAAEITPIRAEQPTHSGYLGPRRTILLVDDQEKNRSILARLLRENGFSVIEADSERTAIEQDAAAVDAVLTDQFMAGGGGWMVLREMTARRPNLPVVLISAAPPERPDGIPDSVAFTAHLLKPLDHALLVRRIGELLGLTWIQAVSPAPQSTPPVALIHPDPAEMRTLRAMVDNGQVTEIMAWANDLKKRDPRYAAFAETVHEAACQIDLPALTSLTG
ncbi:hybrid sensor histidine kinase/response regulator [Telmatospirillum siberiense]|nr:hybrid sensor histidine kinase/response regulator [Telmatospirillum siberiense]